MPELLLVFVFALLLGSPAPATAQNLTSGTDLAALFSLRSSLGLRARDWPRRSDHCSTWTGVSCRGGRVVSVNVSGLRRTRLGRRNPRFAVDGLRNLTRLESFIASGFLLPGRIPSWFGFGLSSSFSVLVLSAAAVTGDIPPSLSQLSNLSSLDLSSNLLSGSIPSALGTLPNLQTLILSGNNLTGQVPPQLGNLSSLSSLDLSFNSLLGAIPDDLKNLRSLRSLDLAGNSLSGSLPNALFSGLLFLKSVIISQNNFSGAIPASFWSLSGLEFVDLSYNNLTGTLEDISLANASAGANVSRAAFNLSNNLYYGHVPSGFNTLFARYVLVDLSGNYFQGSEPAVDSTKNVSFAGNCLRGPPGQRSVSECQQFYAARGLSFDFPAAPTPATSPIVSPGSNRKKRGWSLKYILISVFGGIVLLVLVIVFIVLCLMRCGGQAAEQRESGVNAAPSGAGPPPSGASVNLSAVGDSFTYDQLIKATSEFSDDNLIKHGHSGDLFHGILEGGVPVVVKKIDLRVVKKEGHAIELDVFAKASHTRLVPFLGHCLDNENVKFLLYKFMPNRDLSSALYRKNESEEEGLQSLDWITRLKIATGVAEALCFLHHECVPPLVHRDIQASSILLDDKFEVRLGSLSEVSPQEGDGHQKVITRLLRFSQTSEASSSGSPPSTCAYDVYCFGKVLLELVTGKLGISGSDNAMTNEWMDQTLPYISIYEKELVTNIVDPSLIVDEDLLEEVWAMAIVAKSCLNPKPSKRPLMRYILKALENPLKVVREENGSGSARLRATSSRGSWNAALFGSWRHSSSEIPVPPREDNTLKRSGTMRSQGSCGEHSFNHKRPSKEIFPEPSGARDTND
ncbi:Non-specific serine/threonine protein kinase protein [Dioscorea alata]|uniref:Non-specific serine/threonine protein kinase protein n=1 Tax=Dioscorea alata TaxID=55571 RepID=A0ACB7WNR4_DIOAL|nr:Non-specific serine/threonine protein kinase protein [Dioscorea alata]